MTVQLPRISRGAGVPRDPDKGHAAVTAHARRAGADGAAPLSGGITQTGVATAVLPFAARQTGGCGGHTESQMRKGTFENRKTG